MNQPRTDAGANATWTIRRILHWAADDFRSRSFESPRLEAEVLLGHALDLTRIELITQSERVLKSAELDRFRELVRRRRTAEPVAYLVGKREFYGLAMRVDSRVLIPRPDTETLVEVALERSRHRSAHGQALDLCTGSGCVAIAFAHLRSGWKVLGVDISEQALQVAEHNALRLGKIMGVCWLQSDLYAAVPVQRFDLITANPPYIPSADVLRLESGIREFEPRLALDGGDDGLGVTRRIIADAPKWLEPQGVLAIEIGSDQGSAASDLFEGHGFSEVKVHKDYGSRDRVVSGRWLG